MRHGMISASGVGWVWMSWFRSTGDWNRLCVCVCMYIWGGVDELGEFLILPKGNC